MSLTDLSTQRDTIKSQKIPSCSERQSEIQTVNVVNTVRIKRTKCVDKILQFIQLDEHQCSSKEDRTKKQRCIYYFSKSCPLVERSKFECQSRLLRVNKSIKKL